MARHLTIVVTVLAVHALIAPAGAGLNYVPVVTWEMANGGGVSTQYYAAVGQGTTVWSQLALQGGTRIVKTTGVGTPGWATTEIMSQAAWTAASGETNLTSFYGFSLSGDYLQFGDASSDAIWRVEKNTGALATYVSKAQIQAHTGASGVALGVNQDTGPNGEFGFYDSTSKTILMTNGAGNLTTLATSAQLTSTTGTNNVNGMCFDPAGNLYWGMNTGGLYKRTSGGAFSQVLTNAQIWSVTGGTSSTFKDIFAAPDGYVYFNENASSGSKGILRFLPSDPAGTLQKYLTGSELLAGPASTDNIYQINWYDNKLAFNVSVTTAGRGYYVVVPEPATIALLGLGLLLVRRRGSVA